MMWLPSCPWPCFMSETNVLLIGFSEIGEDVDSLAFGFFSEILIPNGAFWINLSHQLRAEISQIYSNIFHSSPATYFILVGPIEKRGGPLQKKGGSRPHGPPPPPGSALGAIRVQAVPVLDKNFVFFPRANRSTGTNGLPQARKILSATVWFRLHSVLRIWPLLDRWSANTFRWR